MQRLQEITITADRPLQPVDGAVENMSRVVCALLMKALRNEIETPDFWKISIRINSASASEDNKVLLGVLVKNRSFPSH